MAKLRVTQSISNENYTLVFSIDADSISDEDMSRIKKFGAPSIDFGGSFTNGNDITFSLPNEYYDIPNDFPVTKTFTLSAPSVITSIAGLTLYRSTLEDRISSAFVDLRAMTDGFTGEFVTNI